MVQSPPKTRKDTPWRQYRREKTWRLLEPGWAGQLDDDELAYVQARLKADDALSYWWGFRPGQKTRSEAAVRRIAVEGNPEDRARNVRLTRIRRAEVAAKSRREAA